MPINNVFTTNYNFIWYKLFQYIKTWSSTLPSERLGAPENCKMEDFNTYALLRYIWSYSS